MANSDESVQLEGTSTPLPPTNTFLCSHDNEPKKQLMSCQHEYCISCLADHIDASAERGDVLCPYPECESWMTQFEIRSIEKAATPLRAGSTPLRVSSFPSSPVPVSTDAPTVRSIQLIAELISPEHPKWMKDEDSEICMACKSEFSIFNRRHHCRYCGKLYCGNCCPTPDGGLPFFEESPKPRKCVECADVKLLDNSKGFIRHEL